MVIIIQAHYSQVIAFERIVILAYQLLMQLRYIHPKKYFVLLRSELDSASWLLSALVILIKMSTHVIQ